MYAFILSAIITFFVTITVIPKFIVFLKNIGAVGIDIQKKEKTKVAEIGGLPVLVGFLSGILCYIAVHTFYFKTTGYMQVLAATLTVTLIVLIGMLDDLTVLLKTKSKGQFQKKIGFRQRHKFLMPLAAAVPLMVVNSGVSTIQLPFFGNFDAGLLYPLILIPLGIFGASNATNMLAGLNGLEASLGVVALSSLGLYAYINGSFFAAAIAFIFVSALFAFLIYNWYPARIFPGDSLNYTIGAVIASVAIIGNVERFAVFIFALWFLEFFLKARSKFKAESFGILLKNGCIKAPYEKIYSVTHIFMNGKHTETQIVARIVFVEIVVCAAAFLFFGA